MNIVIDSSVWLEYLTQGPKVKKVERYFRPPQRIVSPVVIIYEIYKKIKKERGEAEGIFVMAQVERMSHAIIDVDQDLAIQAADISIQYRIPMADAFIYTSALISDATLVTMDSHFKDLPGVQFIE